MDRRLTWAFIVLLVIALARYLAVACFVHPFADDFSYAVAGMRNELLPRLLDELRASLDGVEAKNWQRNRIVLACVAACAEALPGLFNQAAADLEALLLQATQVAGSFSTRRFAITALSYLRTISPAVLDALLTVAADIPIVQADALAAADRFYRLAPALGRDLPPGLLAALRSESSAVAYTAVRLLQALGLSPAAGALPGLRSQIVAALSDALHEPASRREVWLMKGDSIEQEGTLDQHLYSALLVVEGYPW